MGRGNDAMGNTGTSKRKTNEGWQGKKEPYGCEEKGMLHFMWEIDRNYEGLPGFGKSILSGRCRSALQEMLSGVIYAASS